MKNQPSPPVNSGLPAGAAPQVLSVAGTLDRQGLLERDPNQRAAVIVAAFQHFA
jgi:hypothetical protein